jgi:hypothetical protein
MLWVSRGLKCNGGGRWLPIEAGAEAAIAQTMPLPAAAMPPGHCGTMRGWERSLGSVELGLTRSEKVGECDSLGTVGSALGAWGCLSFF